jgi:hypothetical protein
MKYTNNVMIIDKKRVTKADFKRLPYTSGIMTGKIWIIPIRIPRIIDSIPALDKLLFFKFADAKMIHIINGINKLRNSQ